MFNSKRYLFEFLGSMILFVLAILGAVKFRLVYPDSPLLIPVLLSPSAPIVLATIAVIRELNRMDELQQKITHLSSGITIAVTGLVSVSYGILEEKAGLTPIPLIWVFPFMLAIWGISLRVIQWRYR